MDNSFFSRFYPRVIDVRCRDRTFWLPFGEPVDHFLFESTVRRNFMFVYSGSGSMTLNGIHYPLIVGSLFYFPLKSRVALSTSTLQTLQFFSVNYDYKLIEWDGSALKCSEPAENAMPLPLVTQMPNVEEFTLKMKNLYHLWQDKPADYERKARQAFLEMLDIVCEHYTQKHEGDPAQRAVMQCMEYIKNHYDEQLEREDLANFASLSISHFNAMFKKIAGCTPKQYITKIRLDKAMQLLQSSDLNVSEVARKVGFQDPLYFTRVFTNHTGVSPREYRKL